MAETESIYNETVSEIAELTNEALDRKLEGAAIMNEQSEMLLCCYLAAVRERKAFREFGYADVYDYDDDEVYVGYSPGYYGYYWWGGGLWYGTGWRYRAWHRRMYFGRPATFGEPPRGVRLGA